MFYRDGWLMEALANMSALLYTEKYKGIHSAELMLDNYRNLLLEKGPNGQIADAAGPVSFGPRLTSSQAPSAYRTITYGNASMLMDRHSQSVDLLAQRGVSARIVDDFAHPLQQSRIIERRLTHADAI